MPGSPSKKHLETKESLGLCLELQSDRTKLSCLTGEAKSSAFSLAREAVAGSTLKGQLQQQWGEDVPPEKQMPHPGQISREQPLSSPGDSMTGQPPNLSS